MKKVTEKQMYEYIGDYYDVSNHRVEDSYFTYYKTVARDYPLALKRYDTLDGKTEYYIYD